jgi:hypothetical protein
MIRLSNFLGSTYVGVSGYSGYSGVSAEGGQADLSQIMEDVVPAIDGVYDIGLSTNSWYNIYLKNGIYFEEINLLADQSVSTEIQDVETDVQVLIAAWSVGGDLITGRMFHAGAGTQDAALAFGGQSSDYLSSTEEYNGTSWSAGGNLIQAKDDLASAGTQDAGLAIGGQTDGGFQFSTEEYDGTSWSAGGNLITARGWNAGAGTQDAGLTFGGNNTYLSSTEEYNGTSWSSGGNLITARSNHAGAGTQDAGLAFGGYSVDNYLSSTEEYDGTSWSAGGSLSTARSSHAGAGTQNAGLAFGGIANYTYFSSTEEYDGTSWSYGGYLIAGRAWHAGAGTQDAALAFGGDRYNTSYVSSTEEYNKSLTTIKELVPTEIEVVTPLLNINSDISVKDIFGENIFGTSLVLTDIVIVDNVITPINTQLYATPEIIVDGGITVSSTNPTYLKFNQIVPSETTEPFEMNLNTSVVEANGTATTNDECINIVLNMDTLYPQIGVTDRTSRMWIYAPTGTFTTTKSFDDLVPGELYDITIPTVYYSSQYPSFLQNRSSPTTIQLEFVEKIDNYLGFFDALEFRIPPELTELYNTPSDAALTVVTNQPATNYIITIYQSESTTFDYSILDTYGSEGMFRYNPQTKGFEGHNGTEWGPIGGSVDLDWANMTNKPDPVITVTLTGDVTGTANTTLTDLASGTISVATSVTLSYSRQKFTGNGTTTSFSLWESGRNVDNILVFVNGLCFEPTEDYTVSGTSLVFVEAPSAQAEIVVRYLPIL